MKKTGKKNRKGKVRKLTPKGAAAFEEQRQHFIEKFGREPGPDDPVFFREDRDEPTPLDPLEVEVELAEAMDKAGIDPAIAHAILETGIFPSEASSEEDLLEFQEAVEEYDKMKKH